jgi:hypothetical protein
MRGTPDEFLTLSTLTGFALGDHADMAPFSISNDLDYFTSVPCLDTAKTRLRNISLLNVTVIEQALWFSLAFLLEALYRQTQQTKHRISL